MRNTEKRAREGVLGAYVFLAFRREDEQDRAGRPSARVGRGFRQPQNSLDMDVCESAGTLTVASTLVLLGVARAQPAKPTASSCLTLSPGSCQATRIAQCNNNSCTLSLRCHSLPTLSTMASLNTSTNGPSIKSSYQGVVNSSAPSGPAANSPTYGQWAVFSVSAPLVNAFQQDSGGKESILKVQSTGGPHNYEPHPPSLHAD